MDTLQSKVTLRSISEADREQVIAIVTSPEVNKSYMIPDLTPEQAEVDERRSVLLQCIGASEVVYPDFFVGTAKENATYMLCSDGFRHEITPDEIYAKFQPSVLLDDVTMNENTLELIELNKQRNERDNISVVLVRTY